MPIATLIDKKGFEKVITVPDLWPFLHYPVIEIARFVPEDSPKDAHFYKKDKEIVFKCVDRFEKFGREYGIYKEEGL